MKTSQNRILTTHTGSLPRPADLVALLNAKELGEAYDRARVRRAHRTRDRRDRGAAGRRRHRRRRRRRALQGQLDGLCARRGCAGSRRSTAPVTFRGATRDSLEFPGAYEDMKVMLAARSGALVAKRTVRPQAQVCTGPIKYVGQDGGARRHREPEGGARRRAGRGGVHHRDLAVQSRALLREPLLRLRRGISRGARRRDARGIQGDRRCRLPAADRRSAHGDALQSRASTPRSRIAASSSRCASRR